jgi:hypothetical protein
MMGLAAAAVIALGAGSARAADGQNQFVLRGIGSQSCEQGLAMVQNDKQHAAELASWVTGYVTALNRVSRGTYDLVPLNDVSTLMQILGGMCQANPKQSIEAVLSQIVQKLSVARVADASPMVEAKAGDKTVIVREATLSAMQSRLIVLKLFKGPADGQFGDKTAAALKKYQKQQKLPETGLPDSPTVLRMLVEPEAGPAAEPEEKPKEKKKKKG